MSPLRRSAPVISRFCPTLKWLYLVNSVTHWAAEHVALPAPIVLKVPDMWIRDEDNLFRAHRPPPFCVYLMTSVLKTMLPLLRRHPPPLSPRPPPPLSHMYTGASVITTQTDSLSKSARLTYLSVYDNRDDTSETVLSPSPLSSLTHLHRCIGYHKPN